MAPDDMGLGKRMTRRPGDRSIPAGTMYAWAVILSGAGALTALLLLATWTGLPRLVLLCLAAVAANVIFLPTPGDADQTFAPAVAAAGLTVFGAPSAAVAIAFGSVAGLVFVRRRPMRAGLFNAGQWVLATLAAAVVAFLVHLDMPTWVRPVFTGAVDTGFLGGMLAAAVAFVAASAGLTAWRVTLDRGGSFVGVLGASLAVLVANTVVLFALGTVVALAATRAVPPVALGLLVPIALVGLGVLLYAGQRYAGLELDVTHAMAAEMARGLSVVEIARALAVAIDRVLAADIMIISLRPPGESEPKVEYYRGPGGMELARRLEPEGLAGHTLRTRAPVRIADYERDPRRSPHSELVFGPGQVRSALLVPIANGRERWGAIELARGQRHGFSARHERFVTSLADQAALAARALHLQEQTRQQADRLAVLLHAGLLTGATLDPEEAGRQLVERAAEMLGARYAFLVLVDRQARELSGQAALGADETVFTRLRARLDAEPSPLAEFARAIRDRRPVVCDEAQLRASACPSIASLPDIRCALTVPLLRHGRAIGALMVGYVEARLFAESEVTTLESAAAQGALVIEHARQHVATEAQLRRMEGMVSAFRLLNASADPHGVFAVVADGARVILGTDRSLLMLWDGHRGGGETFTEGFSDEFVAALRAHAPAVVGRHIATATHPVVITDASADPRLGPLRAAARREGLTAALFVPLRSQGEFLGTLLLATGRPVAADALALAEVFGEHVADAIRRQSLLADHERRLIDLGLLNRVLGAVSASLDLDVVYRTAVAELSEALDIPRILAYRADGQVLRLAAQRGAADAPREASAADGVMGRVMRTARAEFVASVREDPDYVSTNFDVTTLAVVPVLHEGAVLAVLIAEGVAARPVTTQHFEFLLAFVQQLSSALQNALFYESQRRAHDELQVLYEAARAVSGTLDLRTVLDSMVSVTCRAFGYDNGAIMMLDPRAGDLTVEAGYGHLDGVVGRRLPTGIGISGWVARTGTTLVVDDVRSDARCHPLDDRTQSELAVPLIAEGKVLGVFNVGSARPAAFGPRDLRLLTTLASYAVVAIQNARLFETAQRLAITDGLTELYNHRHLHDSLERVLERARRDGQPVGVIMLEIDHFKRYNDSYGHQSGDEALRTVAGLLRRGSRPSDIVARYGGDEFMVVLPGATKGATQETAERLRRAVEAYPLILADEVITTVTLSVGVAGFPQDGSTVDGLVEAVDRAQYIAKRSGGNKVHVAQTA